MFIIERVFSVVYILKILLYMVDIRMKPLHTLKQIDWNNQEIDRYVSKQTFG